MLNLSLRKLASLVRAFSRRLNQYLVTVQEAFSVNQGGPITSAGRGPLILWAIGFCGSVLVLSLTSLALSPDEAHYWEWSKRLDLAYYSKGPIVSLVIALSTKILGDSAFAVRFPAAVFQALFILLFYRVAVSLGGRVRGGFVTLLVSLAPVFFYQRFFLTTDPLVSLLWVAALNFALSPVVRAPFYVGVVSGLAVLSKYTAALLGGGYFAALVVLNRGRSVHRFLIPFVLLLLPILIWNAQNDWVNIAHNAGHVGGKTFRPLKFIELFGSQILLPGPWIFLFSLWSVWRGGWIAMKVRDPSVVILLATALPLLILCAVVSLTRTVYANWPMPFYISSSLLGLRLLALGELLPKSLVRYAREALFIQFALTVVSLYFFLGLAPDILKPKLQTRKFIGWEEFGAALPAADSAGVITENYDVASEIAFYGKRTVYVGVFDDRRMNQYDLWGGWESLKGQDLLLVFKYPESVKKIERRFQSVAPLGSLKRRWDETELQEFFLYLGKSYDGSAPQPPTGR